MSVDYYEVEIRLGDYEWTVTSVSGPGTFTDDLRVLDVLSFGWTSPAETGPRQPEPLTASLAITVPDPSELADLAEGAPVGIRVKVHPDEDYVAGFFGRITDLQAAPRDGRDGLTYSIAAVDYTVDLAAQPKYAQFAAAEATEDYLEALWVARDMGDFPPWPTAAGFPSINFTTSADPRAVLELIEYQLRQVIGFSDAPTNSSPDRRAILAPNIDPATLLPDVDQPWALDVIFKNAEADAFTLDSHKVLTPSIEWLWQKSSAAQRIFVLTQAGTLLGFAQNTTSLYAPTETVEVNLTTLGAGEPVADFYLPSPDVAGWRLDRFTYLVTRQHTLEELATMTTALQGLMPQWTVTDTGGDLTRGAHIGRPIKITDFPYHRQPALPVSFGGSGTAVAGRLAGATLTVAGGQVTYDLQLRDTEAA